MIHPPRIGKLYQKLFLVSALVIFILFKWHLVNIMWSGRALPPQPDDSMLYVSGIENIRKCGGLILCSDGYYSIDSFNGIHNLAYNLFWGTIAWVFGKSSIEIFHTSFYVAWTLAAFSVLYSTYFLTKNSLISSISLVFLAGYSNFLYHHGFIYATPSIYSVLFFLILITRIFRIEIGIYNPLNIALCILIFFIHPIGIFLILSLTFFWLADAIHSGSFNKTLIGKISILIGLAVLLYVSQNLYLSKFNQNNPYGLTNRITAINQTGGSSLNETSPIERLDISRFLPSLGYIKVIYFGIAGIPFGLGYLYLLLCLWVILKSRYYKIGIIWFGGFILLLLSATYADGYRSMDILWPITYMVYGTGTWIIFRQVNSGALKTLLLLGSLVFIILNTIYSYWLASYYRNSFNYQINPREFVSGILNNISIDSKVYTDDKLAVALILYSGNENILTDSPARADFILKLKPDNTNIQTTWLYGYLKNLVKSDRINQSYSDLETSDNLSNIQSQAIAQTPYYSLLSIIR